MFRAKIAKEKAHRLISRLGHLLSRSEDKVGNKNPLSKNCISMGGRAGALLLVVAILPGCSTVYTSEDYPNINDVPPRPDLKSVEEFAQELRSELDQDGEIIK